MSVKSRRINEEESVSPVIATILMVAITVVLAGTLYVWAANLAESNTDGSLNLYTFESKQTPVNPTDASTDSLAILTMTQGQQTSWSVITVKLSINGAASTSCAVPGQTSGSCILVDSSEDATSWTVGEDVTVVENGGRFVFRFKLRNDFHYYKYQNRPIIGQNQYRYRRCPKFRRLHAANTANRWR